MALWRAAAAPPPVEPSAGPPSCGLVAVGRRACRARPAGRRRRHACATPARTGCPTTRGRRWQQAGSAPAGTGGTHRGPRRWARGAPGRGGLRNAPDSAQGFVTCAVAASASQREPSRRHRRSRASACTGLGAVGAPKRLGSRAQRCRGGIPARPASVPGASWRRGRAQKAAPYRDLTELWRRRVEPVTRTPL